MQLFERWLISHREDKANDVVLRLLFRLFGRFNHPFLRFGVGLSHFGQRDCNHLDGVELRDLQRVRLRQIELEKVRIVRRTHFNATVRKTVFTELLNFCKPGLKRAISSYLCNYIVGRNLF